MINEGLFHISGVLEGSRESNKCFIVAVEHKDAATLVPLARQYILPGTTITSDMWAAYNGI